MDSFQRVNVAWIPRLPSSAIPAAAVIPESRVVRCSTCSVKSTDEADRSGSGIGTGRALGTGLPVPPSPARSAASSAIVTV